MKPFRNIDDWKEQFKADGSTKRRIGMLHALFSPDEFEQELKWGDDIPKIAEALLWAANYVNLGKEVTQRVIQMLVSSIYSNFYFVRDMDEQLVGTLRLLRKALKKDDDLWMDGTLSKQVNKFLNIVVHEFNPDGSDRVAEVVKTVCDFRRYSLLTRLEWIGNEEIILELKSRLSYSDFSFSEYVRNSRQQDIARNLAIHLAASGKLDELVKIGEF